MYFPLAVSSSYIQIGRVDNNALFPFKQILVGIKQVGFENRQTNTVRCNPNPIPTY